VRITVQQLATLVNGQVHGQPDLLVGAARPLTEAGPDDVTFVETDRNARSLNTCRARVVVVPASLTLTPELSAERNCAGAEPLTLIQVEDPLAAFIVIAKHLHGLPELPVHGIDPRAVVHPSAVVGPDASIFPFAVVGEGSVLGARCTLHPGAVVGRNCRLGDDVVLHPHVVLYDGTVLGHRVIVHANSVLGADGFGYRLMAGRHVKVPQFGSVEVGDDVEIGACATIDRGAFQATRIGAGTKIDNLVMIGHNCQIGRHNLLVGQVGIAGSCSTGDYVVMAGQVGVADHVHIGDRAVIGAQSGLHRNVAAGERMLGYPARPEREAKRILLSLDRVQGLCRDVRALKQQLAQSGPGAPGAGSPNEPPPEDEKAA
jgi:UDP-3-O-[3-hydroxymyristoyl] glucosamine N-acyltransferase